MKITLVHPAGTNWIPGHKDVAAVANRMAPLGLASIAAWLEKAGHHVQVHDCLGPFTPASTDANTAQVLQTQPEIVGFSTTTAGFLDGYAMAQAIKQKHPAICIVFGGVHISSLGATLLKRFPEIDYLCLGEGEATLAALADGQEPRSIDGLVWRDGRQAITNPPREHLPELDALPFPAYEKLEGFPNGYHLPLFSFIRKPGASMVTSRGCPHQCSYCDRSVFKRSYRYNSAEYIYEHLRYLRTRFGIRHVNIYDDLFTAHRERIAVLCEMLMRRPLGLQFNCAVRVGYTDDDLLEVLKRAGALQLSVGIETGNTDLMNAHKPGVHLKDVRNTVRRIQAHGMRAKGLFMMGLPGETPRSARQTSDLVMDLELDDMNMSKFTPFHGAPIWDRIRDFGRLDEDWRQMNCLNFVFVPNGFESREALDELYNQHVQRFYASRPWRRRFMRRLWQHRWSLWHLIKNLPAFWSARQTFNPSERYNDDICQSR
jgi:magnesium-protoporphyrin IX monomethyl ester (oxidative) cyclase